MRGSRIGFVSRVPTLGISARLLVGNVLILVSIPTRLCSRFQGSLECQKNRTVLGLTLLNQCKHNSAYQVAMHMLCANEPVGLVRRLLVTTSSKTKYGPYTYDLRY